MITAPRSPHSRWDSQTPARTLTPCSAAHHVFQWASHFSTVSKKEENQQRTHILLLIKLKYKLHHLYKILSHLHALQALLLMINRFILM